ncbi:MAG: hypothetical protein ACOY5F_11305, partial [Pseudomonadota bacterium]
RRSRKPTPAICPRISGIPVPELLKSLSANYRKPCPGIAETRSLCGGRGEAIRDIGAKGLADGDDRNRRDASYDGEAQDSPHGPAVLMPRVSIEPQPHHWNIRTVVGR